MWLLARVGTAASLQELNLTTGKIALVIPESPSANSVSESSSGLVGVGLATQTTGALQLHNRGFRVVAFTLSPATASRSSSYLPTTLPLSLQPDAVPLGEPVVLKAEILNHLNRPVHRSGELAYLRQIIYAQRELEFGEAVINQRQIGQIPVIAYTNNQDVATYVVRGTQVTAEPVYFEATW